MVSINKLGCTKLQLNSWREINLLSYRKPAHFQELNLSSHCAAHLGLETKHPMFATPEQKVKSVQLSSLQPSLLSQHYYI